MRTSVWLAAFLAASLAACGGGGGNPGACLGSPEVCGTQGAAPGTPVPDSVTPGVEQGLLESGTGPVTLTVPNISRLRIQAQTGEPGANFTVHLDGTLLVNEIIGTGQDNPDFDGIFVVRSGQVLEIRQATAVDWVLQSVPPEPVPGTAGLFTRAGANAAVFRLPARPMNLRVQGAYPGASQNFVVLADGRLLVNAIVGIASTPQAFDRTFRMAGGELIEIRSAAGVNWTFTEQ